MKPKSVVINGDCLEAMREMPDNAFDLAIVDPPYGIGASRPTNYARIAIKYSRDTDRKWDSITPSTEYFQELRRVSINQVICGANYFSLHLPPSMGWVSWFKSVEMMGRCFSEIELIYTSFNVRARQFEYRPNLTREGRIHPTQKPVALYKWLLKTYAKPGDTILDTHLGSQSSRIAAWDLGFDFTGYELDPDYFREGNERFEQHRAQGNLFAPDDTPKPTQGGLFG
ncbi:MAG: site-specific DNA-methyltransferase [Desulfurellales bacterium]|nr:MAG: site-specific DNA-methyltransferase [Desulfurellales bacterium]